MRAFGALSAYDFEILVRDLLQAEWKVLLESFSPGKDGGTDVRLLRGENLRTVQCKHHPGSALSGIQAKLKKEQAKLGGLKFGEYWLATSARATPASKKSTSELFSDQGLVPERVLGVVDLENLLSRHPNVERTHVKLYLSSLAVLEDVLNHAILDRQRYFLERATSKVKYFVSSDAVSDVHDILDRDGMCIITGPPGVGKTTIAESIALTYVASDYDVFDVRSATEVEEVWRPGQKQIFLYDDFLGQTSLMEKLDRGEDHALDIMARRLSESKTHKLILTTREYILASAQMTYSKLRQPHVLNSKIVVDVGSYSDFEKGQILFNHVYYSILSEAARESLKKGKAYREIVFHRNYNPRLIESVVSAALARGGVAANSGFAEFMLDAFEHPGSLWTNIFAVELNAPQRVLAAVAGSRSRPTDRKQAVDTAHRILAAMGETQRVSDQDLDVLEGIFINIVRDDAGTVRLGPKNPSIRDFLVGALITSSEIFSRYLSAASPSALAEVLPLISSNDSRTSKVWSELSRGSQVRAMDDLFLSVREILARTEEADLGARIVRSVAEALRQRAPQGRPLQIVGALHAALCRYAPRVGDQETLTAAFWALEPFLNADEKDALLDAMRESWEETMDIAALPTVLEFERAVDGELAEDIEQWLLNQIEDALDNYDRYGFSTEYEMLNSVEGYLGYIEGDVGDVAGRIEAKMVSLWEPDEDDYRESRWNSSTRGSEGGAGGLDGLFALI